MAEYINAVGTFICRVIKPQSGWFGESKEKATPFIRIPLQVEDPDSDQHGKIITYQAYITEGTIDRLTKTLVEALGWDGDLVALDSGEGMEVPEGFAGQLCSIVTEAEDYDGEDRIRVKWLNSVNHQAPKLATEKVKSILSKFGSRAKAIAKASGAAPAPKKPQPEPENVERPF